MDISAQAAVAVDVPPAPTRIDWIREPQALDKWLDRAPGKPLARQKEGPVCRMRTEQGADLANPFYGPPSQLIAITKVTTCQRQVATHRQG